MNTLIVVGIAAVGVVLFILFILALFNKFLVKAASGQALVITGFGLSQPAVSLSSAFVIPLLKRVESIDLTVKTVRIVRRANDSLSCADGIRAEVEVDFYIQINILEDDIRRVAMTIGPDRASNTQILRELFEAKFADALKTAGSKLSFDQLYQNRSLFRDEILRALGQEGVGEVVLNGYRLDDVAIQYLEQLPLDMHDENNVLDAKGRKVIAERTSAEAEEANRRLRQREVTIAEQNREAKTKQLEIEQDIAMKQAKQTREIMETQAREDAQSKATLAEQERVAQEANIAKDRQLRIAEENKQKDVLTAQIEREKSTQIADQEKQQRVEIARIQREIAEAEALRQKLAALEETARQEAGKIKAEEEAVTVRAMEVANREREIDVILARKEAAVEVAKRNAEYDVKAYELITVAKARLDAAALDAAAADKQAQAILGVGKAESESLRMRIDAQNALDPKVILMNLVDQITPQLPELVRTLTLPAEKIESIRVLNINGAASSTGGPGSSSGPTSGASSVIDAVLGAGLALPVLKEIMTVIGSDPGVKDTLDQLSQTPLGKAIREKLDV
ncbi:MAG: hypothetical protein MUC47_08275 [Candidatus Kapabacteria bacterium]|jgi:uncharacterized membrane protein YqiK|nr:hypothetical protein [Candidatus Kapabacteria bacterium]